MSKSMIQKSFTVVSILTLVACIAFSLYAYNRQLFTSQAALQAYITGFGIAGALIFIFFQAIQVVLPILPGGLGCLAGVLLFGPWTGLVYNYIGICIGSIAAFFIARNFGKPILYSLFNEKTIAKYEKWTGSDSKFAKWFAIAIFLPVAPDDFLCYLAGTTQMGWKKFSSIILLGKPFSISLYSLGLYTGLRHIVSLIH
ncbi:MAG: TVP38/TMEM64 family protein [Oscillospiraceae bacterium]